MESTTIKVVVGRRCGRYGHGRRQGRRRHDAAAADAVDAAGTAAAAAATAAKRRTAYDEHGREGRGDGSAAAVRHGRRRHQAAAGLKLLVPTSGRVQDEHLVACDATVNQQH